MRRPLSLLAAGVLTVGLVPLTQAHAAGPLADLTVSCPDLGEVVVGFDGPATAPGAAAVTTDGPVSVQSVRFTAADGKNTDSAKASATAISCDARPVSGSLDQFVPGKGSGATHGTLTVRVSVDAEAVVQQANDTNSGYRAQAVANDPAGYGEVVAFPYRSQIASWVNSRSGSVAIAQRPSGSTTIYSYVKGSATNVTASIVKVQVMATVMYRAQQAGRGLTAWEKSQMVPMIRNSDNNATTALWKHIGGGPAVRPVLDRMGLRDTTPGPGQYWGLTVTSAPDNVVLMDHFARKNPILNDANREYGLYLMRTVNASQDWGVTAGPGDDIAVKNGWLPRFDGWHVNSIGYTHKLPRPYSAAVLTHSSTAGMSTQISTIEGVSRIMYRNTATARGDRNGDGRSDVVLIANGVRWTKTSSNGVLGAPVRGNAGWNATWIGSPGDVTGDGRADLLTRDSKGQLWLYPGTASGTFLAGRMLGRGWNNFTAITLADIDGNRQMDILARTSGGDLVRYVLRPTSYPLRTGVIARGWSTTRPLGVGDLTNDGRDDLVGIRSNGDLWVYRSTGSGLVAVGKRGSGWRFKAYATPADVTGDLVPDIVAWDGSRVWLYPMNRTMGFKARTSSRGVSGLRLMA